MNLPYTSYKNFMIKRHDDALYRIPVDFNFGCPNREIDGSGGCTFCNVRGSAAVQTLGSDSVKEQIEKALKFAKKRYNAKKFMAYVQAYSASFGESQQKLYLDLINYFPFSAVSIGTRPDCITPQAIEFLKKLNKTIEVWVELGVQTIHDQTLNRINRGHNWNSSLKAISDLNANNIPIALHAIIGLPGENEEHFKKTALAFSSLPIQAVKIHNLHIEKGTTLALENLIKPVSVFNEYQYGEHLIDFIRRMPPELPIMRFTTDSLKEELIAPIWNMDKQQFKNYLINQMEFREFKQGDLFGETKKHSNYKDINLRKVITGDKSVTFWNPEYKEHYHAKIGGRLEAKEMYILPSKIRSLEKPKAIEILDICFGMGYNSLTAINNAIYNHKSLNITALEMDKRIVRQASKNICRNEEDLFDWNSTLANLYHNNESKITEDICISILWGDARYTIQKLINNSFDIIYLDAFSSQRNSELWTIDFFKCIKKLMNKDSLLITYSSAGPIRAAMLDIGLNVGKIITRNTSKEGTIASINPKKIEIPLTENKIKEITYSTKGIPFRDPFLVRTNKEILREREKELLIIKNKKKYLSRSLV